MGTDLVVPTGRQAVRALDSPTLYLLEQAGEIAREILDGRIIEWTAQDWTTRKIAAEVGCSQQAIVKRQARLGVKSSDPRGGARFDNRVVKTETAPRPPGDPVHYLPHLLPGATPEQELHELIVRWCHQGTEIAEALDARVRPAVPSAADQRDLLAGVTQIQTTAARLERVLSDGQQVQVRAG
jgi:hypothetical protein